MRRGCADCAIKHLSQAMVLMDEEMLGYPLHRYLAIGHMSEAESELLGVGEDGIKLAQEVRELRREYMAGGSVTLMTIIQQLAALEERKDAND